MVDGHLSGSCGKGEGVEFERNGITPGRISDEPIIGSDIFPTLLEIAGISLPDNITLDGVSIMPVLENREFLRARPLYWRNNTQEFRIALREDDWKIVAKSDQTGFELFNLVADPRETSDQSAHEPELFERLK
jgi:arylsulfatase A-like enzyme